MTPWSMTILNGGFLLTGAGLWIMLPRRGSRGRGMGAFLTAIGFFFIVLHLRSRTHLGPQATFWMLAVLTIASAVATITSRNPVYCAIWFAVSLVGTASLFMIQGAQFLGVATIVVYAGAIVVTFLFVIMLAQADGSASYDRISWGIVPVGIAAFAGSGLISMLSLPLTDLGRNKKLATQEAVAAALEGSLVASDDGEANSSVLRSVQIMRRSLTGPRLMVLKVNDSVDRETLDELNNNSNLERLLKSRLPDLADIDFRARLVYEDVLSRQHVARLGARMFTRHLISVEITGFLLLAALVGAVAIVVQGTRPVEDAEGKDDG